LPFGQHPVLDQHPAQAAPGQLVLFEGRVEFGEGDQTGVQQDVSKLFHPVTPAGGRNRFGVMVKGSTSAVERLTAITLCHTSGGHAARTAQPHRLPGWHPCQR
jgi:hypothetical protein